MWKNFIMKIKKKTIKSIFLIILFISSCQSFATCTTNGLQTGDNYAARIPAGRINLFDEYFHPVGSSLGSLVVPATNYNNGQFGASTIVWTCDSTDITSGNVYFLVATNGDDRVGGYYDIGTTDGLTGVYATYFAYVGLRQTMADVVLTRYWQKIDVTSYSVNAQNANKVDIKLSDIPPIQAELFRVSTIPAKTSNSAYCAGYGTDGLGYGTTTGQLYNCNQPNSYIQLASSDSYYLGFAHDQIGEDSATHFDFWGANNGFAYSMYNSSTLYNTPSCVARSVTPLVTIPTISAADLNNGLTSAANFNVTVECSDQVTSTTTGAQTYLGFQVSSGAYSAAQTLGYVNSSNGVPMLLSDNYTDDTMAKGVGIYISYSNTTTPLTLIGAQATLNILTSTGTDAGWYPILNNATATGSTTTNYTNYSYDFTATLKKIDNLTVTPGKVRATATVVVQVQ